MRIVVLTEEDELIMKMIHDSRVPPSIAEIAKAINKSTQVAYQKIVRLEKIGFVSKPPRNQPRSRTLTDLGVRYLENKGYITIGR